MKKSRRESEAVWAKEAISSAADLAAKILSRKNYDWEVFASANKITTVRFAASRLLETKAMDERGIGVRVAIKGAVGASSSTGTSREAALFAIENAEKAAKSKNPDPDFHGFVQPKKIHKLSQPFDPQMRDADCDELTLAGVAPLSRALAISDRVDVSGASNFVYEYVDIANSEGVDCRDETTFAFASVTAEKRGSDHEMSGIGWNLSRSLAKFDARSSAEEAVSNALAQMRLTKIQPGKYDVVFGHYSITDIAEYILSYAVSLSSVDYGMSYFTGKLGKKVAPSSLSIFDDGTLEGSPAAKQCDDEGTPTQKTPIIERGVLRNFLSDDYYAKKVNAESKASKSGKIGADVRFKSTGNGFRFDAVAGRRFDCTPSTYPTNLVISPGKLGDEELFEGIKRGIYVGRTWYTYPINPLEGDFTCTNRSNTFLIENGEIVAALAANSFRISDNLPRLLQRIEEIGKETKAVTVWGGASAVYAPKIRMSGVNVTYSKGAPLGAAAGD